MAEQLLVLENYRCIRVCLARLLWRIFVDILFVAHNFVELVLELISLELLVVRLLVVLE